MDGRWQDRVIVAAGIGAWAEVLVHSVVDFNMHIPANAMMLFALTGLALGRMRSDEEGSGRTTLPLARLRWGLGFGLMVFGLVYGVQVVRTLASDLIFEKATADALTVPLAESIEQMNDALKYDPTNAPALLTLGDMYRFRASQTENIESRMQLGDTALETYRKALEANPLDDAIQARRGLTFELMGRSAEAFFCYQLAIQAQPHNGLYWNSLANYYKALGMFDKAEQAFNIAAHCALSERGKNWDGVGTMRSLLAPMGIPEPVPGSSPLDPDIEPDEDKPMHTPTMP